MSSDAKAEAPAPVTHANESRSSINEKHHLSSDSELDVAKESEGVDVTVGLIAGHGEESLDPEVARKLRNKLDRQIIPLLCLLYTLQFIDKNSIASSSILGLLQSAHLSANEFNNLTTAFYAGYIISVLPHAWLMQRFPIARYISVNIFLWSIFIGLQPLCHNYGSIFGLRFLLGMSEGCITTGIMTILPMFYTRMEVAQRFGYTFMCNGGTQIIAGFLSFGVAHVSPTAHPRPWMWYMIIISICSVFTSMIFFWRMPNNPKSAIFLTEEEKVNVVKRVRVNQNGIETKVWKRNQFIEAFKDPLAYMFFFYAAVADLQGGTGVEYGIIIKGYGFNTLQTTLLNIPSGCTFIISILLGALAIRRWPNSRTIIGAMGFMPGILACILLITLPWKDRAGLLVQFYIQQLSGVGMSMMISLCSTVVAGHTKKMTFNAIFFVGYCIGQMLCSQFWKVQYRPRNAVPWAIQLSSFVFCVSIIFTMRWHIIQRNKQRDAEHLASGKEYEEFGYVEHVQEDGTVIKYKVPIQFMDITDRENKAFRYPY